MVAFSQHDTPNPTVTEKAVFLTLALASPCAGRELAEMLAIFLTLAATTSTTSTANDLYERLPRNDLYELDSHWSPQLSLIHI